MKKIYLFLLLLISAGAAAQTINLEAVDQYWALTANLRKDIPLTDAAWNAFINLEGNKTYVESEFSPADLAAYRKAIEIAYMPSKDSLRRKYRDWWYLVLVSRYRDQEAALKKYLRDTVLSPAFFTRAYAYVYAFLPEDSRHPVEGLHLYYNCISNDAVSYPQGLFFSLQAEMENKAYKALTLEAHELHHRLRKNISMEIGGDSLLQQRTKGLRWAVMAIPNEGIADQIDKSPALAMPGDPDGIGEWLLAPAPATLFSLDSVLQRMAADTSVHPDQRWFRKLLRNTVGHMPGFYMSQVIMKAGLQNKMVAHADNPFCFFYIYQEAARRDGNKPYVFSDAGLQYLKKLEQAVLAQ